MIDMQGNLELALGGNGARGFKYKISIDFPSKLSILNLTAPKLNTLCKATTIPGVKINQRDFYKWGHAYKLPGTKVYDTDWSATFYLDDSYSVRIAIEKWIALIDRYNTQGSTEIEDNQDLSSMVSGLFNNAVDSISSSAKDILTNGIQSGISSLTNSTIASNLGNSTIGQLGDIDQSVKDWTGDNRASVAKSDSMFGTIRITQVHVIGTDSITYVLHDVYPIGISSISFDDSRVDSINEFSCNFSFSNYTIEPSNSLVSGLKDASNSITSGLSAISDTARLLNPF
jgi:hypothetical protein